MPVTAREAGYTFLPVRIAKKPAPAVKQPEYVEPAALRPVMEPRPEPVRQTIVLDRKPEPTIQTIVLEPALEAVPSQTQTAEDCKQPQPRTVVHSATMPEVSGQSRTAYQTIKVRVKQVTRTLLRKLDKQQRRRQRVWRRVFKRIRAGRR